MTEALLGFLAIFVLALMRMPLAFSMGLVGIVGIGLTRGWLPAFASTAQVVHETGFAYTLSVIPLFILMGNFATQGGISKALFQFASVVMARFKGGLAMAAVMASAAFGAICGSSIATAATITQVALPEMKRHGYSGRLATGTLAAGGTLGILIPPSVPLVIYAILTEQNIAKLFAAATIPGIIAMLGYMIAIAIYVRIRPGHAPDHTVDLPKMSLQALLGVLPIAIVFLVVFGGIYGGLFTPTEGAGVGVACTFVAALLKRELTLEKVKQCFLSTASASAMIFMIFIGADMMNTALALTQVPGQLASLIQGWNVSPYLVVAGILIFYVVLGAVMDELSMILLTIPIFFPMIMGLDFGMPAESVAIWFGVMVLMTVGFGLLAPPVGLNVYVVNGMAKDVPIAESYKGVLPFLASDVLRTTLLLAFPAITLWLVQFVG